MLAGWSWGDEATVALKSDVMEFRVLGPLEVAAGGRPSTPGSERRRTVLAVLLAAGGEVVASGQLVEAVWGSRPPPSIDSTLRSHLSRLRGELAAAEPGGAQLVVAEPGGYRLELGSVEVDAARFERLTDRARQLAQADPVAAVAVLEEAEGLWRGPAFGDLSACEVVRYEAARLERLRDAAIDERIENQLVLGLHEQVIGELEARVAAEPLAERAQAQLMLALYRSGRQADALARYRALQQRLRDELGVDPAPWVQSLHERILRQDGSLAPSWVPAGRRGAGASGVAGGGGTPPVVGAEPLFGRDEERARLAELVSEGRLVTLIGPGGVGKTRLAEQVAAEVACRFDDGVVSDSLASVRDPDDVGPALLAALDAPQQPGRSVEETLVATLGRRRLVLLLDNCEHVLASASQLTAAVLRGCPNVAVLATSREPLRLPGEYVWRVPPLRAAMQQASAAEVAEAPAGALLCSRAAAAAPDFALTEDNAGVVAELCLRLDGMPLAIELAAARLRVMNPGDLLERLSDRFSLLTGGPPREGGRHRTLETVVSWSFELLEEREARLFARLSVFAGPFSLEAVERVCAGDELEAAEVAGVLAELVDKSMVSVERRDGTVRYRLLDTLRDYGAARLAEAGAADRLRQAHADYHLALAEQLGDMVRGPDEKAASVEIDAALGDLRLAHEWLVATQNLDGALRLPAALCEYLVHRLRDEVAAWAERALALPGASDHRAYPAALATGAFAALFRDDFELARARARAVLAREDSGTLATYLALGALRATAMQDGRLDELTALDQRSTAVADELDDDYVRASLGWQGLLGHIYSGRIERARAEVARLEEVAAASGNPTVRAHVHYCHGEILTDTDPDEAVRYLESALELARDLGSQLTAGAVLVALASVHARRGDTDRALALFGEAVRHWRRFGGDKHVLTVLRNLVDLLVRIDADEAAARLHAAVTATAVPSYGAEAERLAAARDELERRMGVEAVEAVAQQARNLSVDEAADEAGAVLDGLSRR